MAGAMKINTNYEIVERTWFNSHIPEADLDSSTKLCSLILEKQAEIRAYVDGNRSDDEKAIIADCTAEFKKRYILECLVGEGNIDGKTLIDELDTWLDKDVEVDSASEKPRRKALNMASAVEYLFPNTFHTTFDVKKLEPEFIKHIHEIVMDGLLENCGEYRQKDAKPASGPGKENTSSYKYLSAVLIEKDLEELCEDTRVKMLESRSFLERVKIAASFLAVFLHIHPFSNGNGRVARLLISLLLASATDSECAVPVLLYRSLDRRGDYLRCLEEARHHLVRDLYVPDALARFLLENVFASQMLVHSQMLDLSSEPQNVAG